MSRSLDESQATGQIAWPGTADKASASLFGHVVLCTTTLGSLSPWEKVVTMLFIWQDIQQQPVSYSVSQFQIPWGENVLGQTNTHGALGRQKQYPLIWTGRLGLRQDSGRTACREEGERANGVFQIRSFFLLKYRKEIDNNFQKAFRDFRQAILFATNPESH